MLNTNTGDPLIHGVVTRGLEYSCPTVPVHSLSQQPCFILSSSEELSVCKVKGGVGLAGWQPYGGLFCSLKILESSVQMLRTPLTPEAPTQKPLPINLTCLDTQDLKSKNVLQEKTKKKKFTETLLWGHPVSSSVCIILDKSPLLTRGTITNVCYRCVVWRGSSPGCERHDLSQSISETSLWVNDDAASQCWRDGALESQGQRGPSEVKGQCRPRR